MVKSRARSVTRSDHQAIMLARAIMRTITLRAKGRDQYVREMIERGEGDSAFRDLLDSSMVLIERADRNAIETAEGLLVNAGEWMREPLTEHRLRTPICKDLARLHADTAQAVGGTMMFQTLFTGKEKSSYVASVAHLVGLENQAGYKVGHNTIATLRMGNWERRPLQDHDIIRMRHETDLRLTPNIQPQHSKSYRPRVDECIQSTLDRLLNRRCDRLINEWRWLDDGLELDMIRVWAETADNAHC